MALLRLSPRLIVLLAKKWDGSIFDLENFAKIHSISWESVIFSKPGSSFSVEAHAQGLVEELQNNPNAFIDYLEEVGIAYDADLLRELNDELGTQGLEVLFDDGKPVIQSKSNPKTVAVSQVVSKEDIAKKSSVSLPLVPTGATAMTNKTKWDVFIAYDDATGSDFAEHLKQTLEKRNIASFVAKKDNPPYVKRNERWREIIDDVIATCNTFVLILSTDMLSEEVTREVKQAFDRNKTDSKFSILICHLQGVPRTDQQLLSAGIDSEEYQQLDFANQYDLARKVALDDKGYPKTVVADQKRGEQWLQEEHEEQDDAVKNSLLICLALWVAGPLCFFFWIIAPSQFVLRAAIAFAIAAFITGTYAHLRHWKVKNVVSWCKKLHRPLLFGSGALVLATLVFRFYALPMYQVLARVVFQTHLREAPYSSFLMFLAMIFGAMSLHLPESSLGDLGKSTISWIRSNKKTMQRGVAAYVVVALATASIVHLDTSLLLATPKVSLVESKYVGDDTVYVYMPYYGQIHAYVENVEIVHIQIPLLLLVDNVRYTLVSNSSETPVILSQKGVETALINNESGRLSYLGFSIDSSAKGEAVASVSYFSDLNASNVLRIESHQKTLNEFTNGTRKIEKEFKITNLTNYNLYLKQLDPDLMATSFSYATNTTAGSIEASYSRGPPFIYIYGQLPAHGTATVTITYNSM